MRPHLAVVVALACACSDPREDSPQPEAKAEAPNEPGPNEPIPQKVPALARDQYKVEVRPGGPGGGKGWISAVNVDRLERQIGFARGDTSGMLEAIAANALGNDEGRIPESMRRHLVPIALGRDADQHYLDFFGDNESIFGDLCGDPRESFGRATTVPSDQVPGVFFDGCELERFGLLTREQAVANDAHLRLHGFAVLVHLNKLGGPHPAEEALVKTLIGVPPMDALGEGPVMERRELDMPDEGWLELTSEEGGYRASFPRPPTKEIQRHNSGSALVLDAIQYEGVLYQVSYTDLPGTGPLDVQERLELVSSLGAGEIVSKKPITFAGQPATALEGEAAEIDAKVEMRAVGKDRRAFALMCMYPTSQPSPCKPFFDSFSLLP